MVFFVGDLVVEGLMHVWVLGNLGEPSRNPFHSVNMSMVIVGSGVPAMLVLASVDVTASYHCVNLLAWFSTMGDGQGN
jgi:hypothetical protein